jgi:hypothetical protein
LTHFLAFILQKDFSLYRTPYTHLYGLSVLIMSDLAPFVASILRDMVVDELQEEIRQV